MNIREKEIQELIGQVNFRNNHSPITFNFQGEGLGECDVISISKAGFIYEYEIKTSKKDFKADFKKTWKHEKLKNRMAFNSYYRWKAGIKTQIFYFICPNYFYYVTPPGLLKVEEIPEYAGLAETTGEMWLRIIKKAPKLHKEKATISIIQCISKNLTSKLLFGCSYMTYKRKNNG